MKLTCPGCGEEFPIEAGLLEADGKRLAAMLGGLDPSMARAALAYLRLFKPAKTALRTVKALRVLQELLDLVRVGTVCRDERGGLHRPATAAMWIAAIDQMVDMGEKLSKPLGSHVYLRRVVFGLADAADAAAEKRRHDDARKGIRPTAPTTDPAPTRRTLDNELATLKLSRDVGHISRAEYDRRVADARQRHAAG